MLDSSVSGKNLLLSLKYYLDDCRIKSCLQGSLNVYLCNSRDCIGESRKTGRRMKAGDYGINFISGVLSLLATTSSTVIIGRYRNMWESREHFAHGSTELQSAGESQEDEWLYAYCSVRVPKDQFMISALPAFCYYALHFLIPTLEIVGLHTTQTKPSLKASYLLNTIVEPLIDFVMVRGADMCMFESIKTEWDPMHARFLRYFADRKPSHEGTIVSVNLYL